MVVVSHTIHPLKHLGKKFEGIALAIIIQYGIHKNDCLEILYPLVSQKRRKLGSLSACWLGFDFLKEW